MAAGGVGGRDTPHHSQADRTPNNGMAITFGQKYPLATHIINQGSTGQNLHDFLRLYANLDNIIGIKSNWDIYRRAPSKSDAREVSRKRGTLYASMHRYSTEWK